MAKLSLTGIAVFAVLTAACGGSPTSPKAIETRAAANPAAGANDPTPAPPDPAPTPPPTPTPGPPAPVPPGDHVETWYATVDVQRAAPGNELPATFIVTVRGDQMRFGPLEVTILAREGHHIYARKGQEITIQIDDEKWTVTSVEVFATGTIAYSQ